MRNSDDRQRGPIAVLWRWLQLPHMHTWMSWAWLEEADNGRLMVIVRGSEPVHFSDPEAARTAYIAVVQRTLAEEVVRLEEESRALAEAAAAAEPMPPSRRGLVAVRVGHGDSAHEVMVGFRSDENGAPLLCLGNAPLGGGDLRQQARACWRPVAEVVTGAIDEVIGWSEVARVQVGTSIALRLWRSLHGDGLLERNPEFLVRRRADHAEWAELAQLLRQLQEIVPERFSAERTVVRDEEEAMPLPEAIRAFESLVRTLRSQHPGADVLIGGRLVWSMESDELVAELMAACGLGLEHQHPAPDPGSSAER
jgi:hypothetical protein